MLKTITAQCLVESGVSPARPSCVLAVLWGSGQQPWCVVPGFKIFLFILTVIPRVILLIICHLCEIYVLEKGFHFSLKTGLFLTPVL